MSANFLLRESGEDPTLNLGFSCEGQFVADVDPFYSAMNCLTVIRNSGEQLICMQFECDEP